MILPDNDQFTYKYDNISGDECILITPNNITCKWTEDNIQFRSLIVRKSDNFVVSRSFSKFFNYLEQPDLDKFPDGEFTACEKKDGSLIIWSNYKDTLIHRTRGTFNAENLPNGSEINFLKNKYKKFIESVKCYESVSILTEWQTKSNIIVINEVNEPTLTLVGIINNQTGHLATQYSLDKLALKWELDRPKYYNYESIEQCVKDVNLWVGKEGVVLYSKDGQKLRKIKSDWYKSLHSICTGIKSVNHVLDVFLTSPKFINSKDFFKYIETNIDYEVAIKNEDYIKQVVSAYVKVINAINNIDSEIENYISKLDSRKDQALEIQKHWNGWMVMYAFNKLDNKSITDKLIKKAMENYL